MDPGQGERAAAIRAFVEAARGERELVVKLLMWEIGKTYPDACKEFDRTIDYVDRTLEALEAMEREANKFVVEGMGWNEPADPAPQQLKKFVTQSMSTLLTSARGIQQPKSRRFRRHRYVDDHHQ